MTRLRCWVAYQFLLVAQDLWRLYVWCCHHCGCGLSLDRLACSVSDLSGFIYPGPE